MSKKFLIFVYLFTAVIISNLFAGGNKTEEKDTVIVSSIAELADSSNLYNITARLASPEMKGRLTGTREGELAENYVIGKMKELDVDFQVQNVKFPLYQVLNPTEFLLLDENEKPLHKFEYTKDFKEVDFSGTGNLIGELVFVGFGIDSTGISPYEKVDVTNKIVVILTGIPEGYNREWARLDKKIDAAVKHGAAATIIVPQGRMAQAVEKKGDEAKQFAMDLRRNVHFELIHKDAPSIFLHKDAVLRLIGEDEKSLAANSEPRELNKKVKIKLSANIFEEVESKNIIGVLHGSDPELAKEVIIIGAHYDHLGTGADGRIYYGASDNASGTAVVLDVAKYFSNLTEKPKRTILFALWCGEEQGLHGSDYYVNQSPVLPLENTKLMIQVDYLDDMQGPILSNVTDGKMINDFAGTAIKDSVIYTVDWGGQCASDDCPFIAKGIPAHRFISFGEHHHRTNDTIENLNIEMLEIVTNVIIDGLKKTAY